MDTKHEYYLLPQLTTIPPLLRVGPLARCPYWGTALDGRPGDFRSAAAAASAPVLHARWVRPQLSTWGATADEVSRSYPGDEFIPRADGGVLTMATTLPVPPEKVWPWLVQMGGERAGLDSRDRLDHGGKPSTDRIGPEWRSLQVGGASVPSPAARTG